MELLLAILVAGPIGFLARTPRRGLLLYLLAWAIVFPMQTASVHFDSDPAGNDWLYWAVNAAILAAGLALNRVSSRLGQKRCVRRLAASRSIA